MLVVWGRMCLYVCVDVSVPGWSFSLDSQTYVYNYIELVVGDLVA